MAGKIDFKIVTQERTVYHNEVDQITIPTQSGEITVLPRHISLVSLLKAGELRLKSDGQEVLMAVSSGIVEIRPHSKVVILAHSAENAEEIDIERAEAAKERAAKMLEETERVSNIEYATLQATLEKELARINVGRKYRNRR